MKTLGVDQLTNGILFNCHVLPHVSKKVTYSFTPKKLAAGKKYRSRIHCLFMVKM